VSLVGWAFPGDGRPGRIRAGLFYGSLAFVAGFLLTYLVERGRIVSPSGPVVRTDFRGLHARLSTEIGPDGTLPDALVFASWQFHTLHLGRLEPSRAVEYVAGPEPFLYAVPPLVLLIAGAAYAILIRAHHSGDAIVSATALCAGYLPLAYGTARWATWTGESFTYHTGVFEAVLATGLLFPLVFGPIGGLLGHSLRWAWTRDTELENDPEG